MASLKGKIPELALVFTSLKRQGRVKFLTSGRRCKTFVPPACSFAENFRMIDILLVLHR